MTLLRPTTISTAQFTYNADTNTMVAEISDLGPNFAFGRVYNDSADEGLTLVSQRTGHAVVMVVAQREYKDGELVAWRLIPADGQQIATGLKAVIFND